MSDFLGRVSAVQAELKAPKGQYNSFGKYKYRSCEDILEAVKPLLKQYKLVLTLSDTIYSIGDRYYIQATATLYDTDSEEKIYNSALARESAEKKGMDDSQITGTASSYARKYALNGLFCIDDTKDADTDEFTARQKVELVTSDSQRPDDAAFPPVYSCSDCGQPIVTIKKRDGSPWPPEEILAYSQRRFGRALCPACQKTALKLEKAAEKDEG